MESINFYIVCERSNNNHLLTFVHCCVFDKYDTYIITYNISELFAKEVQSCCTFSNIIFEIVGILRRNNSSIFLRILVGIVKKNIYNILTK